MTAIAFRIDAAVERDVPALAILRRDVARDLTARHGIGHWSLEGSEAAVQRNMLGAHLLVARAGETILGTLRLASRRPWAIDPAYFTPTRHPLYLTDMAVAPAHQGSGIGRRLLEAAREEALRRRSGAIRLDAYDAAAGAGPFYLRCGFLPRGAVVYRDVPLLYFEWLP